MRLARVEADLEQPILNVSSSLNNGLPTKGRLRQLRANKGHSPAASVLSSLERALLER
jgi:hypothetical protein